MPHRYPHEPINQPIAALLPRGDSGFQFVLYGDCCSGIPAAPHEATFASVNAALCRLWPPPAFICFLGDEISGLTADYEALLAQWNHWFKSEMAWLDLNAIPLYHVPSNHTTYDEPSEQVFRDILTHLPRNGPNGQVGLSYYIRRDDLLLVFINTSSVQLGGDGWVETEWLDQVLLQNTDAVYKLVLGHQPIFPVNGYASPRMCEVEPHTGKRLWTMLVDNGVLAYLCSHMLCFDVQVHEGVLQILTSGAGTAHLLPDDYLHFAQIAVDQAGLRCQTVDPDGEVREAISWPLKVPSVAHWAPLNAGVTFAPALEFSNKSYSALELFFKFEGITSADTESHPQTFLSAWDTETRLSLLWIGVSGLKRELIVKLTPVEGRSP